MKAYKENGKSKKKLVALITLSGSIWFNAEDGVACLNKDETQLLPDKDFRELSDVLEYFPEETIPIYEGDTVTIEF